MVQIADGLMHGRKRELIIGSLYIPSKIVVANVAKSGFPVRLKEAEQCSQATWLDNQFNIYRDGSTLPLASPSVTVFAPEIAFAL
jgi:hypothetical protein